MATVTIASVLDRACTVTFTTDTSGNVTAATITNNSAQTVTLTLTGNNGPANVKAVPPGTNATINIQKSKQFNVDTSPWTVNLAVT